MRTIPECPQYPKVQVFGLTSTVAPWTTIDPNVGHDRARRILEQAGITDPYFHRHVSLADYIGPCPVELVEDDDGRVYKPADPVDCEAYEAWLRKATAAEAILAQTLQAMRQAYDAGLEKLGEFLQGEYVQALNSPGSTDPVVRRTYLR